MNGNEEGSGRFYRVDCLRNLDRENPICPNKDLDTVGNYDIFVERTGPEDGVLMFDLSGMEVRGHGQDIQQHNPDSSIYVRPVEREDNE